MKTPAAVTPKLLPVSLPKPANPLPVPTLKGTKPDTDESDRHLMLMMAMLLSGERDHGEEHLEKAFRNALNIRRFISSKRKLVSENLERMHEASEASLRIHQQLAEFAKAQGWISENEKDKDVDFGTLFKFAMCKIGLPFGQATTNILANLAIDFMRAKEGGKLREQVQKELAFWSNIPGKPEGLKRALKSRKKLPESGKRAIRLVLEFQKLAAKWPGIFGTGKGPNQVMSKDEKYALLSLPISLQLTGNGDVLLQLLDWVKSPAIRARIKAAMGGVKGGKRKTEGNWTSNENDKLDAAAEQANKKKRKKV